MFVRPPPKISLRASVRRGLRCIQRTYVDLSISLKLNIFITETNLIVSYMNFIRETHLINKYNDRSELAGKGEESLGKLFSISKPLYQ